MIDAFVLILFPTTFTVIFVLVARLTSFLKHFALETRCICCEMDHADSYEEYWKWRVALRCHYLMLIPFVNKKNVTRVYRQVFHKRDYAKKKERRDSLVPLLLPSILGVCVCTICVCGMTWAWYSASVQSPAQKITAACYEVKVVSVKKADGEEIQAVNGSNYELEQEISYMVTLRADGTAKECGGYCLIEGGGTKQYTQTFKPKQKITVELTPGVTDTYTFTGVWGSLPSSAENNNYLPDIGSTIQSGTNAPNISPNTDDTVSDLSENNSFESGETSQIPPQDDVIPETNVPEETTSPVTDVPRELVSEPVAADSPESSSAQNPTEHPEPDTLDNSSETQTETSAGEMEQVG